MQFSASILFSGYPPIFVKRNLPFDLIARTIAPKVSTWAANTIGFPSPPISTRTEFFREDDGLNLNCLHSLIR